ncbi:MAG: uroporphyrinogen-III synthase [Pseudomonadota bacterium]
MRIWVTRTAPDNISTAMRLEALGHETVRAPVLEVRPIVSDMPAGSIDAIVFTSRNGVRHHPRSPDHFDVPIFTVGDRTAIAARQAGYRDVRSAAGDVRRLQHLIMTELRTPALIAYFGARDTAGDLKGALERCGHRLERRTVYAALPARTLEGIRGDLASIDAIVVHSPRGARRVVKVLFRTGWHGVIWCISEACAMRLTDLPHLEIHYARRPDEEALINLVRHHQIGLLPRRSALRLVGGTDVDRFGPASAAASGNSDESSWHRGYDEDLDDDAPRGGHR